MAGQPSLGAAAAPALKGGPGDRSRGGTILRRGRGTKGGWGGGLYTDKK